MISLGTLPGTQYSQAYGVSGDGSVVVGESGLDAFRWTETNGMEALPLLPGANGASAYCVSRDGSVIAGYVAFPGADHMFRWTSDGGMQDLGWYSGAIPFPQAISGDGSTIVGFAEGLRDYAFRWTSATGIADLGLLAGTQNAWANGVNGDGSIVVG